MWIPILVKQTDPLTRKMNYLSEEFEIFQIKTVIIIISYLSRIIVIEIPVNFKNHLKAFPCSSIFIRTDMKMKQCVCGVWEELLLYLFRSNKFYIILSWKKMIFTIFLICMKSWFEIIFEMLLEQLFALDDPEYYCNQCNYKKYVYYTSEAESKISDCPGN